MRTKTFRTIAMLILLAVMFVSLLGCAPAATEAPKPAEPTKAPEQPAEPTKAPEQPAAKPFEGMELTLASMTDQYVTWLLYTSPSPRDS